MERIDDLMLNAIAQDIGPSEDKTRVLGLNLKLELTTIRQHISPNGGNVSASDRLKMILDWRERTPREQQKVRMKTALEISGFGEIADRYFGEGRLSGVGEKRKLTPTGNNFYMEGEPLPSVSRLHNGDNNHAEDGDEREEEVKRRFGEKWREWRDNQIKHLEERYKNRDRLNLDASEPMSIHVPSYSPKLRPRFSNSETSVKASHHDIFRPVKNGSLNSKRILVSGNNLTKNTALSHRLAYDWAMQDSSSSLVDAHVVLEIDLKEVRDDQDLADAVEQQLFQGMDLTADVIRERIKANPQAVTVLLDGLSEFSKNGYKGDILDILYGKALMDLTVMVTSRPRAAAQLRKQALCDYTYFEL